MLSNIYIYIFLDVNAHHQICFEMQGESGRSYKFLRNCWMEGKPKIELQCSKTCEDAYLSGCGASLNSYLTSDIWTSISNSSTSVCSTFILSNGDVYISYQC
ncbi:uncharacterized protein LOC143241634 isoform X1 [Tachypleus tridentatus]|uniref:uncharacterized protein LOC143241634 isoform X1 n=1 Tax=Tachypleus tridentatus TaxID=6853 RepID=UPI003FD58FCC